MWSEDFVRIEQVANEVTRRGSPFKMTLDHSHIVFKMDNKEEQALFGLAEHIKPVALFLIRLLMGIWRRRFTRIIGSTYYTPAARCPTIPRTSGRGIPTGVSGVVYNILLSSQRMASTTARGRNAAWSRGRILCAKRLGIMRGMTIHLLSVSLRNSWQQRIMVRVALIRFWQILSPVRSGCEQRFLQFNKLCTEVFFGFHQLARFHVVLDSLTQFRESAPQFLCNQANFRGEWRNSKN